MVELVGASAYASRPIGSLSGGEQQRLLIAQALVREPEILLLDEPLDSLDLSNQGAIASLVQRICASQGVTVLLVAHDVNPILGYLDRVVYFAGGRGVQGTPREVIDGPTLSRLYGAPIEVLETSDGRLVVVGTPEPPAHHHGSTTIMARLSSPGLSWNLVSDYEQLTEFPFMVNALQAGTIVAVMAGAIGWFMVLRRQTFAGHTLSVIAFPGAAAAILAGLPLALGYFGACGARGARARRGQRRRPGGAQRRVGGDRHRPGFRASASASSSSASTAASWRASSRCSSAPSSASPPGRWRRCSWSPSPPSSCSR